MVYRYVAKHITKGAIDTSIFIINPVKWKTIPEKNNKLQLGKGSLPPLPDPPPTSANSTGPPSHRPTGLSTNPARPVKPPASGGTRGAG